MVAGLATNIYIAVFRSSYTGYGNSSCGKAYQPLGRALNSSLWPYDIGDDPSFFSQQCSGFNLTWGVCRQQVRNRIRPGDIVVFFSVRCRGEANPFEYCFCAVATVEKTVRQTDIWRDAALEKKFARYLNLLIRPHGQGGWQHYEPGSEKPHKDWLWRIAEQDGFRRKDFTLIESNDLLPPNTKIHGRPVSVAENYIVFSSDARETRVLAVPPLIALCESNGQPEKWLDNEVSHFIQSQTLEVARRFGSRRDSLRSIHKQHSHPVIRWKMHACDAALWRAGLLEVFDRTR